MENVPEGMKLEAGMMLTLSNQAGQPAPVVVLEVTEDVMMLDANHFLAGKRTGIWYRTGWNRLISHIRRSL